MKKNIAKIAVILITSIIMASLSACNKGTGEQETVKKTVNETVNETDALVTSVPVPTNAAVAVTLTPTAAPVLTEDQIKENMTTRALLSAGNNYRMKKVIEKAKRGEDVTLAYIGGSITEGYNAGTDNNFAKLTYEYFADTYGTRDTVHLVNAGLSGTPSTLGLIRSEQDIFAAKPDIIFIEFAVNDSQTGTDPAAFESLIAKSQTQDNEPAVVLLFSMLESGYTCQTQMALAGFRYKLPMISIMDALKPELDAGRMVWDDWSKDESHPNEYGHQLYSEFIINYWKTIDAVEIDVAPELPDRLVRGINYSDMQLFDKSNTEVLKLGAFHEEAAHKNFPNGWVKSQGMGDNKGIQFKINAKNLFVVFKEVNDATFGNAEVYVDGKMIASLAGNTKDGWGKPQNAMIFNNKEAAEHTVEIKMAAGDEDKAFAILGFGVCQ